MTIRIKRWEPENMFFWLTHGRRIANRNLILSTCALHLNFNIWMMWSMVVVNLPAVGFLLTSQQQFLLVSIPGLVGALMRIAYSWAWSWVGGGTWMALSTLFLLLPALGVAHVVQDIATPFPVLLFIAACCGIGGGASASHLPNISFFFPKAAKGFAMGINAGLGNLGVSVSQLVIALLISVNLFGWSGGEPQIWGQGGDVHAVWLQNAGYCWTPFIALMALICLLYAHDMPRLRLTPFDQLTAMKHRHTWTICLLYLSSYGTFLGLSAAFPLLSHALFPLHNAMGYAFIGPMLCALVRPFGGWLGDHLGGGITTMISNVLMAVGTAGVLASMPGEAGGGSFWLFLGMVQLIFAAAGIGNGSSYQLAPKVFMHEALQQAAERGETEAEAYARGGRNGALAMNISSVGAAFGGFFIPKSFGNSLTWFNSFVPAFALFFLFYVLSTLIAWLCYTRRSAAMRC
ncbi:nitrite extrusion protein [Paludibacterium purpuratum]|uniref:NNP family nitrate/nitrite transporter-like MFS transporter n=1 Tax=Paludibacterium purpuratum TaxID=1144873 RepID=A0A4V3DV15_9NEIS|nr:nitrite extrusion protein [Paludibacterium purpuratum]TDR78477.1 NNP family nitrate/nitrite transporter-like MFS transporter [Paludibacterium purpuratum]